MNHCRQGAAARLQAAEARLEAVLERELDAALEEGGEDGGFMGIMSGTPLPIRGPLSLGPLRHTPVSWAYLRRSCPLFAHIVFLSFFPFLCPDDDYEDDEEEGPRSHGRAGPTAADAAAPPSFCKVDLSLPDKILRKRFPLFPGLAAAVECIVEAGQMLYLPTGVWDTHFHTWARMRVGYKNRLTTPLGA